MRIVLLSLLLALAPAQAQAQTRPGLVSFQRIAIPDDVPAHLSAAMVQDRHGFLWIGTQDGLVRYDGYSFKVYRPAPNDPASLGGSYVRSLLAAPDGRIWVGTFSDGLSVFDPRSERFVRYRHDDARPASLAHDRVEAIAQDRDGMLWVATDNGLDRLDPASGQIRHFRNDPVKTQSLANNQVRSLLVDREARLWVGTRGGLQRFDGKDGFIRVPAFDGQHLTHLLQDKSGRIWAGTVAQGAAVLDPASGAVQRFAAGGTKGVPGLSHPWIYALAEVAGSEMWIGTFGGGIDVIDLSTLAIVDHLRFDSSPSSIGSDRVGALLTDRSGLAWVGTWGGGLARHDPSTRAFRKLRYSPLRKEGLTHQAVVRAMQTSDARLWLGTNGDGIDVMDAAGHLVEHYRPDPKRPGALADGAITCMIESHQGVAWVATLDGTLHRMRRRDGSFERFDTAQGLPGGPIRTMVFAPDGALWVGSLEGLARIDAHTDAVRRFVHQPNDPATLSGREVESLAFTPDGTLWVGTEHGVNAFDTRSGRAVRIVRDPARADSLPDNWVPDLMVARDGRLWLATQSGVAILTQWDGKTASFDHLNERLGLPARPAESLLEDAQGMVWLGSRIRIDPASWQFRSFDRDDGNEFSTLFIASRSRTSDGALMFGSPEGLLMVEPAQLPDWRYRPAVQATALTVDGVAQSGAGALAERTLRPPQHDLRLEFAALDLSAPHKLRYRYQLEGYDSHWIDVDARARVAAYAHLPPGSYLLRVQGSNRNGQWSPAEWQMRLTVAPAYYQTWWFKTMMWTLVVLAVAGLFRLRLRQLRRRSAQLERTVIERTASLEAAYLRIEQASLTDPLTGLHNRRYLEQVIDADLGLVQRRHHESEDGDHDLVLYMLDLDHFKQVNDQYGHAAGDAVLIQTAALLRQCMRASDHVVRWGGEEFLLVARFMDRQQAAMLAEKIRATVAGHDFVLPNGRHLNKTVSIGFAPYPFAPGLPTPATLDLLQHLADQALYAAKRSWRNAWVGVSVVAQHAEQVAPAVRAFLDNAEGGVASGAMEVQYGPVQRAAIQWL